MGSNDDDGKKATCILRSTTNTRQHGGFVKITKHKCEEIYWNAYKIQHLEVPMANKFMGYILDVTSQCYLPQIEEEIQPDCGHVNGNTHNCVQIDFHCHNCSTDFSMTYEFGKNGKYETTGRYTVISKCNGLQDVNFFYSTIQIAHEEMYNDFNPKFRNCKHWSREFYLKLTNKKCLIWDVCSFLQSYHFDDCRDEKFDKSRVSKIKEALTKVGENFGVKFIDDCYMFCLALKEKLPLILTKYKKKIFAYFANCHLRIFENLKAFVLIVEQMLLIDSGMDSEFFHSFKEKLLDLAKDLALKDLVSSSENFIEYVDKIHLACIDGKQEKLLEIDQSFESKRVFSSDNFSESYYSFMSFDLNNNDKCLEDCIDALKNCFTEEEMKKIVNDQINEMRSNISFRTFNKIMRSLKAFYFILTRMFF